MQKDIVDLVNWMYSKKSMAQFLFFILLCLVIHLWVLQYFYYFADNFNIIMSVARKRNFLEQYPKNSNFILVWNKYDNILRRFKRKTDLLNCSISNCIFTEERNLLYSYLRYDAIIFNEYALNSIDRPGRRSKYQLYIFSSQKSSYEAPACELYNDNFFNITFTYKLDSDVVWSYIAVRNLSGGMIVPSVSVSWKESSEPVSSEITSFLKRKRKAAVWLVNGSKPDKSNLEYITRLQEHLFHYSLKVDVYGQPPVIKCPHNDCQKMIREKYYFYMAFENSFAEDFVTDLVLHAYNNYAVPIVYGGANYSRFLPPGSYINAREIHAYNLAAVIHEAIKKPALYEAYFRWKNLYVIEDSSKSLKSLCDLCETVHKYKAHAVIKPANNQFRRWWNSVNGMKRCLSDAYKNETANLNGNYSF